MRTDGLKPGLRTGFGGFAGFDELLQGFGVFFKEVCEVGQDINRRRAEVMLDAFDVLLLSLFVETKEREKPGEGLVTFLNASSDGFTFFGEDQTTVLFVIEVAQFPEFLDHAGDGSLFHVERGGYVDDARVTFLLD